MFRNICCASKGLDPDLARRARANTVAGYLKAVSPFVALVEESNRADADSAEEIDELVKEFRYEMGLT